jgi:hypothetical protein
MRRLLFTVMSVAVVALVPASAIARSHHRHHHHHKHHQVRTHTFGRFTPKSQQTTPTTTPPASQTAGTVTSFDPATGKLVITLSDGTTTETGLVTRETEIECQAMNDEVQGDLRGDHGPGGGDSSGGGDTSGGGDENGNGGDNDGEGNQNCSASLTAGATVLGAELRVDSSGATWEKVELAS